MGRSVCLKYSLFFNDIFAMKIQLLHTLTDEDLHLKIISATKGLIQPIKQSFTGREKLSALTLCGRMFILSYQKKEPF